MRFVELLLTATKMPNSADQHTLTQFALSLAEGVSVQVLPFVEYATLFAAVPPCIRATKVPISGAQHTQYQLPPLVPTVVDAQLIPSYEYIIVLADPAATNIPSS